MIRQKDLAKLGFKKQPTRNFDMPSHNNFVYNNIGILVSKTNRKILAVVYDLDKPLKYFLHVASIQDLDRAVYQLTHGATVESICKEFKKDNVIYTDMDVKILNSKGDNLKTVK